MLEFEWDEFKNSSNRNKHGIWFEEAQSVFDDLKGRLFLDAGQTSIEDRYILIGFSSSEKLLVIVHCYREAESRIRIISARQASKKERAYYEEGI